MVKEGRDRGSEISKGNACRRKEEKWWEDVID